MENTTKEYLLEIQAEQLAEWKILLKQEVFEELEKRVLASNNSDDVEKDIWKIKRGVNIEMILLNEVKNLFKKYNHESKI